ncbi:MAG: hypothetical protein QXJ96_02450 [Candidatus Aenigmatarchaeota archaeon]|nr:hypothetical protein [Candidatus Aenigmarchaeota archaeon]
MKGSEIIKSCCAYCNHMNENLLYEPLEENCIYYCKSCGRPNFITFEGRSKRLEDVTKEDVLDDILLEPIFDMNREEIERHYNAIMKRVERCKHSNKVSTLI